MVSFSGNDSYEPAQQEIELVAERIPVAELASTEASSTVTDVAAAFASVDASMVAGSTEEPAADTDDGGRSPWTWFYVALVVVGGAALLITAGLVFRGIYGRSSEPVSRRTGSLDMILDQTADDDQEPGSTTPSTADADSGEDIRPRRDTD